jgi:2-dehydro-3-deoxy-D-arabinonate dehydratase
MKLYKIRVVHGSIAVAVEEEGRFLPLDLSLVENVSSLSDILHSPDPLGLARFLIDAKSRP